MASLKVGQRVKVVSVGNDLGGESYLNQTGVLTKIEEPDAAGLSHLVVFDEVEFWYRETDLEAVDKWPAKTDTPFKAGDTVEYKNANGKWCNAVVKATWQETDRYTLEDKHSGNIFDMHGRFLRPVSVATPSVKPLLYQEHTENEPKSPRVVLLGEFGELAMRQPHLFFAGEYRDDVYNIAEFAKSTPNFILMATMVATNQALGGTETQPYYLVFVIAEGQA